ncbi:HAD family hydrolase [Carnobacterium maltaromaticum]|uniref:HAD family hydrolase n=1 Tax=Carnobacterium maltaromaticum TaxID=2751 RepID=UPI00191BAE7C|nr:HAD family hydrolase [Carnobacterium maltaromaticum]CAD5901824.1 HAD family hydrolase [Carnobacterium maltaromaticum]
MNLLFDVDDTLYEAKSSFDYALKISFPKEKTLDFMSLYHKFREISDSCLVHLQQNSMTLEEMHDIRIRACLLSAGIEMDATKAREFQRIYQSEQEKMCLLPEMEAILKTYSSQKGVKLGIITNGSAEHQMQKIARLDIERYVPIEHMFVSGTYGIAKPHTELFKIVQNNLQLNPEKTYYIGDSYQNDVVGAKSVGWSAIWVNRMNRTIPEKSLYQPDYTIRNTGELAELVRTISIN